MSEKKKYIEVERLKNLISEIIADRRAGYESPNFDEKTIIRALDTLAVEREPVTVDPKNLLPHYAAYLTLKTEYTKVSLIGKHEIEALFLAADAAIKEAAHYKAKKAEREPVETDDVFEKIVDEYEMCVYVYGSNPPNPRCIELIKIAREALNAKREPVKGAIAKLCDRWSTQPDIANDIIAARSELASLTARFKEAEYIIDMCTKTFSDEWAIMKHARKYLEQARKVGT